MRIIIESYLTDSRVTRELPQLPVSLISAYIVSCFSEDETRESQRFLVEDDR